MPLHPLCFAQVFFILSVPHSSRTNKINSRTNKLLGSTFPFQKVELKHGTIQTLLPRVVVAGLQIATARLGLSQLCGFCLSLP